jgi:2'-hydroxyisoflavone reductase
MWIPEQTSTDHVGLMQVDVSHAVRSGLTFRAFIETARDTLAWERTRAPHEWRAGLERDRERALLEEWKQAMIRDRS